MVRPQRGLGVIGPYVPGKPIEECTLDRDP
jgi:hypothetical protein